LQGIEKKKYCKSIAKRCKALQSVAPDLSAVIVYKCTQPLLINNLDGMIAKAD
jgi:hypothetical protein